MQYNGCNFYFSDVDYEKNIGKHHKCFKKPQFKVEKLQRRSDNTMGRSDNTQKYFFIKCNTMAVMVINFQFSYVFFNVDFEKNIANDKKWFKKPQFKVGKCRSDNTRCRSDQKRCPSDNEWWLLIKFNVNEKGNSCQMFLHIVKKTSGIHIFQ